MIRLLRAADVRAQDAAAQDAAMWDVAALMDRAGYAVAQAARTLLGRTYGARIAVICGPGNNGGDGRVAARVLRSWGASIQVIAPLDGDAVSLDRCDLVVDALFGVGPSRAPTGAAADAIDAMNAFDGPVLAVDVPSGVDADTGAVIGAAVRATATVTFTAPKTGLLFEPGNTFAGRVITASIGLANDTGSAWGLQRDDVATLLPERAADARKTAGGRVLLIAGSNAMPGAAVLSCLASVRGGAGYTTIAAPEDVTRAVAARVPEATTVPLPASEAAFEAKGLEALRARLTEATVLVIGPGLGRHPATAEAVRAVLSETTVPVVVDADALWALQGHLDVVRARTSPTVLTPHAGEFTRLFGDVTDRLHDAERSAIETGAIIVLKGPGTVTAGGARTFVNITGDASLAQGGSGDVLAGLIGAFLAQAPAVDAATITATAVWIHGRAAERLSARRHPQTSAGSTLADEIGPTMHEVLHG